MLALVSFQINRNDRCGLSRVFTLLVSVLAHGQPDLHRLTVQGNAKRSNSPGSSLVVGMNRSKCPQRQLTLSALPKETATS